MNFLVKMSYHPMVIRTVRALGLRHVVRKMFYWWERPRDGVLPMTLSGTAVKFFVRSPEELRMLQKAETGHWEGEVMDFLKQKLAPGDVVYDVGSNIGLYAVLLGKLVGDKGSVIAFEPEQKNYDHLLQNLDINSLRNVHVHRVALGAVEGEGKLYSGEDLLFANLLKPREDKPEFQVVKIVEGDKFRDAENLPVPRAVKIDVEGYEYSVLQGLKKTLESPACQLVICEVHPTLLPAPVTADQVLDLLRSYGFNQISRQGSEWIPEYHAFASKA